MRHLIIFLCLSSLVVSCAAPPKQSKSILLPQKNGETGKIVVRSDTSGIMLDKPYTEAVYHAGTGGFLTRRTDPGQTRQIYGPLLAAEPDMPLMFTLFFMSGPAELTPDSRSELPRILEAIQQNPTSGIDIIGHTDTVGSPEMNDRLSRARALRVAEIFQNHGIDPNRFSLQGLGETDLRVPTPDNTPEPDNRRVEVVIRQP